jgi:hypothetical protein
MWIVVLNIFRISTSRMPVMQLGGRSCILFSDFGIILKLIKLCLIKSIAESRWANICLIGFLLRWFETRRCFIVTAFQLCFIICQ